MDRAAPDLGGEHGHAPGALKPEDRSEPRRQPTTTPSIKGTFDAATSRRVATKLERSTNVFQNVDGSLTRQVYSRPVNFKAADGSWQPIDTTLVTRADGRLHMSANDLQVSVASQSDAGTSAANQLVSLALPTGQVVAYSLDGAANVTPVIDGPTAMYQDVLPQTDVELTTFDSGIKETLVLKSANAPNSWLFPLRLQGLIPQLTDEGSIALLDASGKAVAWFPRAFATRVVGRVVAWARACGPERL